MIKVLFYFSEVLFGVSLYQHNDEIIPWKQ